MTSKDINIDHTDDPALYIPEGESSLLSGALNKALNDQPWHYAIKLRDGTVMEFSGASWSPRTPDWIRLKFDGIDEARVPGIHSLERGLDVRISEIVWAIDAPWGS